MYDPKTANKSNWIKIQKGYLQDYFDFMAKHWHLPYKRFSIIQGGDGGMEYLCTYDAWRRRFVPGFTGLFVHEATPIGIGVIGTNEAAYPWMDEGFTSYAEEEFMNTVFYGNGSST